MELSKAIHILYRLGFELVTFWGIPSEAVKTRKTFEQVEPSTIWQMLEWSIVQTAAAGPGEHLVSPPHHSWHPESAFLVSFLSQMSKLLPHGVSSLKEWDLNVCSSSSDRRNIAKHHFPFRTISE